LWDQPSKPSSKVEESVQTLKESISEKKPAVTAAAPSTAVVKKSMWQKVKDELIHYYHGFRLLFIDINVSRKLVMRVLNGKSLSRREHRQVQSGQLRKLRLMILKYISVGANRVRPVPIVAIFSVHHCPLHGVVIALGH
jgi:hypothetical protein